MTIENLTVADVISRTRAFIQENFLYMRSDIEFGDDDLLLKRGIVDSMGVVEVLEFLTEEFEVTIEDDEVTEENLGSLNATARFVFNKLSP
jgi:acyl carrier protein